MQAISKIASSHWVFSFMASVGYKIREAGLLGAPLSVVCRMIFGAWGMDAKNKLLQKYRPPKKSLRKNPVMQGIQLNSEVAW